MAKCIIEEINAPEIYQFEQTEDLHLRIYADQPFMTYHGQFISAGSPFTPNSWYLRGEVHIEGGNIPYIEQIEIDTTEDSPTNRAATYTAWWFSGDEMLGTVPYQAGIRIPAVLDPSSGLYENQTWPRLVLHRDAKNPPPRAGVYDIGQVEYLIAIALGSFRPVAGGEAYLEGGVALVAAPDVLPTSVITLTGQDDDVSGALRVNNKVQGVGFTIVSSNGADSGTVGWVLHNG